MERAYLLLEDGTFFPGMSFGAPVDSIGETEDFIRRAEEQWRRETPEYLEFADPDTISRTIAENAPPDEFTRMWKSYYDTMAIKERLNPRLLRRCLPVRYWKHLPERQQNLAGPANRSTNSLASRPA